MLTCSRTTPPDRHHHHTRLRWWFYDGLWAVIGYELKLAEAGIKTTPCPRCNFHTAGVAFTSIGYFRGVDFPFSTDAISQPNAWCAHNDHEGDTQPPCPPQYHFSLHVAWLMKRYSEAHVHETQEIRFWPNVIGQNRPPSRLQLRRKVAATSNKWTMDNYRRLESSLWCDHWAAARSCYWVRMHSRLKSSISSQKWRFYIRPKWCRQDWNGSISRNNSLGVSIQLLIFPSCHPTRGIDALLRRFGSQ